jgi:hypothetical protein
VVKKTSKKLEKPLDKPHRMCYNECVKRRGKQKPSLAMVEQKSSKNLLTNSTRCAIIKTLPRENKTTIKRRLIPWKRIPPLASLRLRSSL